MDRSETVHRLLIAAALAKEGPLPSSMELSFQK